MLRRHARPRVGQPRAARVATGRTAARTPPLSLGRFRTATLVSELAAAAVSH